MLCHPSQTKQTKKQVSAYFVDHESGTQLSLALERSHGVASLSNGAIDVVQHRRVAPYAGSGGTVVLDDSDKIFTETWLSIGNTTASNRLRAENKLRLNRKVTPVFGRLATRPAPGAGPSVGDKAAGTSGGEVPGARALSLPPAVHLQSVRATTMDGGEMLIRLQHTFAVGEDPVLSANVDVDVDAYVASILPAGLKSGGLSEMTMDGSQVRVGFIYRYISCESYSHVHN